MPDPLFARLSCGCRAGFRPGVEGSPVTIAIEKKADGCQIAFHVSRLALFDHREALRPSTRLVPLPQSDYEEG